MFKKNVKSIKLDEKTRKYLIKRINSFRFNPALKYPWRQAKSEFHALIAEILLQRTKAEQVVPVYKSFIKIFPSSVKLSRASINQIKKVILPLGLSWRAGKLKHLGRVLVEKHGGIIPEGSGILLSLPGVGQYASAAFLSLHRNKPATIIDSNIIRMYGRFLGFNINPEIRRNKSLVNLLERITPETNPRKFNYALLDFTRSVCSPKPQCALCFISERCRYFKDKRRNHG